MTTRMMRATWLSLLDLKAEKDSGHINGLKFKGVLLILDEASNKPPNGSHGHKILIPKEVAEKNLHTLIGMGIDYEDSFDKHNPKKKVGVIQKAWIVGNKLMCSGLIWRKDFPDIEKALDDKQLGMSFEGSNILVEDPKADVWKITDVCFTGAAILYKTAAAYQKTEALAAAADCGATCAKLVYINGGKAMSTKAKEKSKGRRSVSAGSGEQDVSKIVVAALRSVMKPLNASINTLTTAVTAMSAAQQEFQDEQLELLADGAPGMLGKKGKKGSSSSDESESEESSEEAAASSKGSSMASSSASSSADSGGVMKSKGKKKVKASSKKSKKKIAAKAESSAGGSSEDESVSSQAAGASSDAEDASSLEDMDESDSVDSQSEAPGHKNKHANENKGNKTHVSTKRDKHPKAEAGMHASSKSARRLVRKLLAEKEELLRKNKKLTKKAATLQAQAEEAAEAVDRKSEPHVSARLKGLLAKGAIDISTLAASGEKMAVAEMDAILDKVPSLDLRERIALKAEAARLGVMDEGRVEK